MAKPKLAKTAAALLAQLEERGRVAVQFGLHRGRGGTGKLRHFGERDRKAALKLVELGLAVVADRTPGEHYVRGFKSSWTDLALRLPATP